MLSDRPGDGPGAGRGVVAEAGAERRGSRRRKLPFGRGAVLSVAGRQHVVGLVDLSVSGAYVATRAQVAAGAKLCLSLVLPPNVELRLPCTVVRTAPATAERQGGLALRFPQLDEATRRALEAVVNVDRPRAR